jgi:hypothetical protein
MASRGKKKTTMAKLNRETKLREKREEKAARKEARKLAALHEAREPEFATVHATEDPDPVAESPARSE